MTQWGIFNDESQNSTEAEAVEAGFYSREAAEAAVRERYRDEDELSVAMVEEPEEDDENEPDETDEDDE